MTDMRDLKRKDFVRVRYPSNLVPLVRDAEATWRAFCSLPDAVRRSVGYQPDTIRSGVGYQPAESGRDPKEHFHVRLAESEWLYQEAKRIGNPTITRFIESALLLAERLKPFAQREFLEAAETEFGIAGLVRDTMSRADFWTLRFVHYYGACSVGDVVAADHCDKGAFTAHLLESGPGFERYTHEGAWEPVEFGNGETMIIAGLGLQYRSGCVLTAMNHRVVANEQTSEEGRFSIVAFFDFEGQVYYDKKTWGPTQNFGPGFFYNMPFPEFRKYFQA